MRALLLVVLISCLTAGARWYEPPILFQNGEQCIDTIPAGVMSCQIHVRLGAVKSGEEAKWKLTWGKTSAGDCTEALVEIPRLTDHTGLYPSEANVCIKQWRDGIKVWEERKSFSMDGKFFSLKLVYDGVSSRLYGGFDSQQLIAQLPDNALSGQVSVSSTAPILCQRSDVNFLTGVVPHFSNMSEEKLEERLSKSTDPIEGKWQYLDRDIDQARASLGGKYTIAIVKGLSEGYDIIYLDGAEKESGLWQSLQIKGHLQPTIYENNYNLEWIDVRGKLLNDDNNAELSHNGNLLTLRFPIYKSQVRLSRLP